MAAPPAEWEAARPGRELEDLPVIEAPGAVLLGGAQVGVALGGCVRPRGCFAQ